MRTCLACNSEKVRTWGQKSAHDFYLCRTCGYIFTQAKADTSSQVEDLYNHYYDNATFEPDPVVAQSLNRLVRVGERFRSAGRWLDIGYGEGTLLKITEANGWQCYGTELSPRALEFGEKQGWIVSASSESDSRFPPGGFDVVTMIEVIEHVFDPRSFLKTASRWVRPGGGLYLTTPNGASLNRHLLGLDWSIFAPPEHISIWTGDALSRVLEQSGFQPWRIRTEGFNPAEILARRPARMNKEPVNRNQAGRALNNAFSSSPIRRAVKRIINQGLSATRLGDGLKVWAIRKEAVG